MKLYKNEVKRLFKDKWLLLVLILSTVIVLLNFNNAGIDNKAYRSKDVSKDMVTEQVIEEDKASFLYYDTYRESIRERYESVSGVSILSDGKNFKDIETIFSHYENLKMKGNRVETSSFGVNRMMSLQSFKLIAILIIIYLGIISIYNDRNNNILNFKRSTPIGYSKLYASTVISQVSVFSMWYLISYSLLVVCSYLSYGPIPFSAAIQSISGMYQSVLGMNIFQYFILDFSVSLLVYIFVIVLISLLFYRFKQASIALSIFGIVIWGLESFKLFNPASYFGTYKLVMGFNTQYIYVIILLMTVIVFLLGHVIYKIGNHRYLQLPIKSLQLKPKVKPKSLRSLERSKLLFRNGAIIFGIGFLLYNGIHLVKNPIIESRWHYEYNSFVDLWGPDPNTINLEEVNEVYLSLLEEQQDSISYDSKYDVHERISALESYKDDLDIALKNQDGRMMIHQSKFLTLFESREQFILYLSVIIALITYINISYFSVEHRSQIIKLQASSVNRSDIKKIRNKTVVNTALIFTTTLFLMDTFVQVRQFPDILNTLEYPVQSLWSLAYFKFSISIGLLWVINFILRLIVVASLSKLFLTIASTIKEQFILVFIAFLWVFLPISGLSDVPYNLIVGLQRYNFITSIIFGFLMVNLLRRKHV